MERKRPFYMTMRRVGALVYALLFAAEIFLFKGLFDYYNMVYLPFLAEVLYIAALGAMAVWLFAGQGEVAPAARQAVGMGTLLLVAKTLLCYSLETQTLDDALLYSLPSVAGQESWLYGLIVARLMLLVVAAFFVLNARADRYEEDQDEDGDVDVTVVAIEEETTEEEDR